MKTRLVQISDVDCSPVFGMLAVVSKTEQNTYLLVEVVNAVDFVVKINSEGNAVQAVVTNTTSETSRVIVIAHGLKNLQ